MSSTTAHVPAPRRRQAPDPPTRGAGAAVAAVLLGMLVAVLTTAVIVLVKVADDARDDAGRAAAQGAAPADASGATHDHAASASVPTASFAGAGPDNAADIAAARTPYDATMPAIPAGPVAKVHMTLKDVTLEIAPGVKYRPGRSTAPARPARSSTSARGSGSR